MKGKKYSPILPRYFSRFARHNLSRWKVYSAADRFSFSLARSDFPPLLPPNPSSSCSRASRPSWISISPSCTTSRRPRGRPTRVLHKKRKKFTFVNRREGKTFFKTFRFFNHLMMLVPHVITLLLVTILHRSRIFVAYIVVLTRVQYILHDRVHLILLDPAGLASMTVRLPFPRVIVSVRWSVATRHPVQPRR